MELARQVPQVVREMVRLTLRGGIGNELRILGQLVGQVLFLVKRQQREVANTFVAAALCTFLGQFSKHAADARVGILNVIDRVFIGLGASQIDIEGQL